MSIVIAVWIVTVSDDAKTIRSAICFGVIKFLDASALINCQARDGTKRNRNAYVPGPAIS